MVALNARLQLLRTGQRQQEAMVELFHCSRGEGEGYQSGYFGRRWVR